MNRLQDDYDPYAVEEPSDEEPALSRWAPAPPRSPCLSPAPEASDQGRTSASRLAALSGPFRILRPAVRDPVAPRCRLWNSAGGSGEVLQSRGRQDRNWRREGP